MVYHTHSYLTYRAVFVIFRLLMFSSAKCLIALDRKEIKIFCFHHSNDHKSFNKTDCQVCQKDSIWCLIILCILNIHFNKNLNKFPWYHNLFNSLNQRIVLNAWKTPEINIL